jgi:hypothetical protein
MRQVVIVIAVACACLSGAIAAFADSSVEPPTTTTETTTTMPVLDPAHVQRLIDKYRRLTWRWQRVMEAPVTLTLAHPPADPLERIRVWRRIAVQVEGIAQHPPHQRAWACIHRYEGSWTDAGGPYYGGLQMDLGFQRTYGRELLAHKGTANNWTPLEQMWVAERALRAGRGFWPWPNTARYCGLL